VSEGNKSKVIPLVKEAAREKKTDEQGALLLQHCSAEGKGRERKLPVGGGPRERGKDFQVDHYKAGTKTRILNGRQRGSRRDRREGIRTEFSRRQNGERHFLGNPDSTVLEKDLSDLHRLLEENLRVL